MVGEILKELRKNADLTQKELADKIGMSDSSIRMIELGKRSGTKNSTKKIADFFNVPVTYLEGRADINGNLYSTSDNDINTNDKNTDDKINEFLNILVEEKVITDANNIPESIEKLIMYNIKQELDKILKERS